MSRFVLILLCLIALSGCNPNSPTTAATQTFEEPPVELNQRFTSQHGVSLRFPEGWRAEEIGPHIILTDQMNALIGGSVFVPTDEDLEALADVTPQHILTDIVIHHVGEDAAFNPDDIHHFEIEGRPAASYYYSREIDEMYMVIWLPDDRFAILTFAAPEDHLAHFEETARKILASIE